MSLILSVDIGGTNCRLAAFRLEQGNLQLEQKIWHKTADLTTTTDFLQACQEFLPCPKAMVVAVAGPIQATGVKVTNATLELDLKSLQTHFPQVQIINDFVAQAWAVLTQPGQQAILVKTRATTKGSPAKQNLAPDLAPALKQEISGLHAPDLALTNRFDQNITTVPNVAKSSEQNAEQNSAKNAEQNSAKNVEQNLASNLAHATLGILGAGTGLGAASLYSRQGQWQAMPSELGHTLFPFIGPEELELQKFCSTKLDTWQINYDDILTGRGLSLVHEFLSGHRLTAAEIGDKFLSQTSPSSAPNANPSLNFSPSSVSSFSSVSSSAPNANSTLDWFARLYARACRTWIMNTLCSDGLYLAGGIAAKNPALVHCASFKQELMAGKTNTQLIVQTPIWLMSNSDSGLWGAAYVATKMV